jgi:hypothetical protein
MKTKKKLILSRKCNWCNRELILNGKDSDSYVINAEYKYFCIIQDPGKPAERDCMKNYLEDKNEYPIKKKLEEKKEQEEKEKEKKETRLEAKPRVLSKLADLDKFFKERQFKNRYQR